MSKIEEDPVLGRFFDTPEKKAKILVSIKIAMIVWIIFVVLGIFFYFVFYLLK